MKSRMMRCAGHIASMGEIINLYRLLVGKFEGSRELGKSRNRWEVDIKRNLQGMVGKTKTGLIWLRIGTSGAGCCDYGDETFYLLASWSRVLLENLTGSQLVKKFSPPMKLEGSLPRLQVPVTCPYLESDQSSPCPYPPFSNPF
jgi:hypothetical protein